MKKFLKYTFGTIYKPMETFQEIKLDPEKIKYAWIMIVVMTVPFLVSIGGLALAKIVSPVPPFLNIPQDKLYVMAFFVGIPAQIFLFMMMPAIIQLLSIPCKGHGMFEEVFAINTYVLSVPFFLYWAFEMTFLIWCLVTGTKNPGTISAILVAAFMGITVLWQMVITPIAVYVSQGIKKWQAILIGIFALLVYWGFSAIFFG